MTPAEAIAYRAVELGAMQKEDELAELLEQLLRRPPARVLEIGAFMGGTLYAWSQLGASTVAIDLAPAARFASHGARMIWADSHDPRTRDQLLGERFDMLHIDGDHSLAGVVQDLGWYGSLVNAGGLVVFHAILPRADDPSMEVYRLWRSLEGRKREIVRPPKTWGGIGILEL